MWCSFLTIIVFFKNIMISLLKGIPQTNIIFYIIDMCMYLYDDQDEYKDGDVCLI